MIQKLVRFSASKKESS